MRRVSTPSNRVVVVGAGNGALVAELVAAGYRRIDAVDISAAALSHLRDGLGERSGSVTFRQADVRDVTFDGPVDVWHDRATFHFLTSAVDQVAYARRAVDAVRPGGHLVIATFGPAGPQQCSGLPVARHDATSLAAVFGPAFEVVEALDETHRTPWGAGQQFLHALLRRVDR